MSQKSTPRSPKSPRSKSPSCEDVDGLQEENFDDLQKAIEEELRSSDRILGETRNRERSTPSRSSHQPSNPRSTSRSPSPLAGSTCEEDPRLPSPPVSPVTYGSRAPTPGTSRRSSKLPSPQYSRGQPEDDEDACPDEGDRYKYASSSQSPQRGASATRSASLKIGSVTFRNDPSRTNRQSQMRYGYDVGTSVAGLHPSRRDMASSAVRMNQSYLDAATSNLRMGQSCANAGASNGRMGPSCLDTAGSNVRMGQSYTSSQSSRTASSRMDSSFVDTATSGAGFFGVDQATSSMNYKTSRDQSPAYQGTLCSPRCKKFNTEFDSFTSGNESTPREKLPLSPQGGRRTTGPQMASPSEMGHHGHHGHQPASKSNFDRLDLNMKSEKAEDGHHHHEEGSHMAPIKDEKVISALEHLSQLRKTPSYFRCGLNQGTDFLKVCSQKAKEAPLGKRPAAFPEIPCLRQEEIDDLIKCENQDVDSAWFVMSEERKTYKKPCPKQQKAQMTVKALVQAHEGQTCSTQKEYSPLDHPDPDDISPEVAAAMMFAQERGIKMEECPNDTIASLFQEEQRPAFPEKIPQSSVSVVDRGSKDQDEMIEKSASVPSEGVSDSAYTRTMKEKGEDMGPQKSFDIDFAIGPSKREYVFVAEKPQRVNKVQYRGNPPPWSPGFLSAFPDDDGLKIVNSPSGLFHKAWVHSNPGNMPTSDVIVID